MKEEKSLKDCVLEWLGQEYVEPKIYIGRIDWKHWESHIEEFLKKHLPNQVVDRYVSTVLFFVSWSSKAGQFGGWELQILLNRVCSLQGQRLRQEFVAALWPLVEQLGLQELPCWPVLRFHMTHCCPMAQFDKDKGLLFGYDRSLARVKLITHDDGWKWQRFPLAVSEEDSTRCLSLLDSAKRAKNLEAAQQAMADVEAYIEPRLPQLAGASFGFPTLGGKSELFDRIRATALEREARERKLELKPHRGITIKTETKTIE